MPKVALAGGSLCHLAMNRTCRHACHHATGWNVADNYGIGADYRVVSDRDAGQDGDASANPHVATDVNPLPGVSGSADGSAVSAGVICVADAGVLPDAGTFPNEDFVVGNEMDATRDDNIVS
jgi:hypothetical protein